MSKIYKILTDTEWKDANRLGYIKTDLDDKDGFIHCSTAKQLALTLHLYFKEENSVVLCEIDECDLIRSEFFFEKTLSNNRAEEEFPHIYGKFESRTNRKMGHITIINKDLKIAKKIANEVKETIIITSRK